MSTELHKPILDDFEQWKLNIQLLEASKNGNKEKIKELVVKGADMKYPLNEQLWSASREGDNEKVKQLLDQGANINYESGWTVLGAAADSGHTDTVRLLIFKQELDINKRDSGRGMNALHWSCLNGHIDCARLLIEAGIDLQATDDRGDDAVLYACQSGNPQLVELLMKQGLSLSSVNKDSENVMHMACQLNHIDMIKFLMTKGYSLDSPEDKYGKTPRMRLSEYNEDVKQFLEELKSQDNTENPIVSTESTDTNTEVMESTDEDSQQDTHLESDAEHKLVKLAKDAISNGQSVKLRALKGILVGGPGVGKTITYGRLTRSRGNIEVDGQSRSTGVEKPDIVHLYHNIEKSSVLIANDKQWSVQPLNKQLQPYLHCLQHPTITDDEVVYDHTSGQARMNHTSLLTQHRPLQPSELNKHWQTDSATTTMINFEKITHFLKLDKLEEVAKMIGDITVLYMIDLGGQPEYFEILPLLLHGAFLGIIFLNLSLSLTERFNVTYRHTESTHSTISYTASYCQIDMVHKVLALIEALSPDKVSSTTMHLKSHACLIGTHKDVSSVNSNTIDEFEKEIIKLLKDTSLYYLVKTLCRKFIYPIDNLRGNEAEIEGLRKALTDQICHNFESQEINIRWGVFHLRLQSEYEKRGFCSLKEAIQLGLECGLQRDYVKEVLKYLHFRFGTILYYHDVPSLSDRVICNPNLIFRPLTQIIADSFGSEELDPQIAEDIRNTGIIPAETFKKACHKKNSPDNSNELSTDQIAELLKHHRILSKLTHPSSNGESILFMPCLLHPCNESAPHDGYDDVLLFTFSGSGNQSYGFQPIGLFYAFIAKLLCSDDFSLEHKGNNRFRNKIRFMFKREYDTCIEVWSKSHYLEVRIIDEDCEPETRIQVGWILHEQIKSIMKELPHTKHVEAKMSFFCPDSIKKKDLPPHTANLVIVRKGKRKLRCSNTSCGGSKTVELTEKQKSWLEVDPHHNIGTSSDKPGPHNAKPDTSFDSCNSQAQESCPALQQDQILDVDRDCNSIVIALTSIHHKWYQLGTHLNIPIGTLQSIAGKHNNDHFIKMSELISTWVGRPTLDHHPCWRVLCQSLSAMGEVALAEKIAKDHHKDHHDD